MNPSPAISHHAWNQLPGICLELKDSESNSSSLVSSLDIINESLPFSGTLFSHL